MLDLTKTLPAVYTDMGAWSGPAVMPLGAG